MEYELIFCIIGITLTVAFVLVGIMLHVIINRMEGYTKGSKISLIGLRELIKKRKI